MFKLDNIFIIKKKKDTFHYTRDVFPSLGVGIVRIPDSEGNNQSIKTTQLHALELEFQFLFLKTERRYLMGFVFQQF
jgi:hypothetical protein